MILKQNQKDIWHNQAIIESKEKQLKEFQSEIQREIQREIRKE